VDQDHPEVVFASACSGVYRSVRGGQLWPSGYAARRLSRLSRRGRSAPQRLALRRHQRRLAPIRRRRRHLAQGVRAHREGHRLRSLASRPHLLRLP
jgi:hypothetical protein